MAFEIINLLTYLLTVVVNWRSCAGDYGSAIETLVTAVSLIKQSKIVNDDRCRILISALQDTLHGIELKSYGSKCVLALCLYARRHSWLKRHLHCMALSSSRMAPSASWLYVCMLVGILDWNITYLCKYMCTESAVRFCVLFVTV